MSRKTKRLSAVSGAHRRNGARILGWMVGTVVAAGTAAAGMFALEGRIINGRTGSFPTELRAELTEAPEWMPDRLRADIERCLLPAGAEYYDKQLTDKVRLRALANPWVRGVRRTSKHPSGRDKPATLAVDAEFRMPIARAMAGGGYAYLDMDGVRLPAGQVPRWASWDPARPERKAYHIDHSTVKAGRQVCPIHYMLIVGVETEPPPRAGQWLGDDLAAGLELVRLVAAKSYAYQITEIDVRNYDGRIDPNASHLRMWAELDRCKPTEIRFGRLPKGEGDYVVSPQRKFSYLDKYAEDHNGRLAGINAYIDLRYDELHLSIN